MKTKLIKETKNKNILICVFIFFGIFVFMQNAFAVAYAEIIFEDNFDSKPDWTLLQPTDQSQICFSGCNVPSGWFSYFNGLSYCTGGPGNNNIYLNNTNARGTGKSLTYWTESCGNNYNDSDGNIAVDLGQTYSELYVRFYIKFKPNFQWLISESVVPQQKLMHVQYYTPGTSPYYYFRQLGNHDDPFAIIGIKYYKGDIWYLSNYSGEMTWNMQGGTPSYSFDVSGDHDHANLGPWLSTLGDGNWHCFETYFKMNTNNGSTFNKDGVHKFWLDGILKYDSTTHNGGQGIPWSENGSTQSPRRGFRAVVIGGNNGNYWNNNCTGIECEQFYAIDDIVVSASYIGPNYTIGLICDLNSDGKVDITDVQACVNHFLGAQDYGTKADVNSDGKVDVVDVQAIVNIILGG